MSPRWAARADTNQAEIVRALRGVGASVQTLHRVGQGCPDLLCAFRMRTYLLECKSPGGSLTEDELDWINGWRAEVHIVDSVDAALAAIGAIHAQERTR